MQAKVPTSNKTDKEKTVDEFYTGPNNISTGHYIFKLKKKEKISVQKAAPMLKPELIIKVVNEKNKTNRKVSNSDICTMK